MNSTVKPISYPAAFQSLLQLFLKQKQDGQIKDSPEIETLEQRHQLVRHVDDLCDCV